MAYDGVSDGWVLIRVFHMCREVEAQFTELNTHLPTPRVLSCEQVPYVLVVLWITCFC